MVHHGLGTNCTYINLNYRSRLPTPYADKPHFDKTNDAYIKNKSLVDILIRSNL